MSSGELAMDNDPFPDSEHHPLVSEAIEAAAVRVAVCLPDLACGLDPARDLTIPEFRAIATIALANHERGVPWDTDWLFRLGDLGVTWQQGVAAYLDHHIDVQGLAHPSAVREARNLGSWRRLREHLLRAAIACEQQDMPSVLTAIDAANEIAARARSKIVRAA